MDFMGDDYITVATTDSALRTHEVGACLARCLQAGDVVLLTGD